MLYHPALAHLARYLYGNHVHFRPGVRLDPTQVIDVRNSQNVHSPVHHWPWADEIGAGMVGYHVGPQANIRRHGRG